jgi:hypothetical protein
VSLLRSALSKGAKIDVFHSKSQGFSSQYRRSHIDCYAILLYCMSSTRLPRTSNAQIIIHRDDDLLIRPKIPLGGLDRGMPQQEFDLLEVPTIFSAELMGWSAALTLLH